MANITKRGDSYLIVVSDGYCSDGKKVRKSMTYKPGAGMTEKQIAKEVQRQAVLFEEKVKSGGMVCNGKITFAQYAEQWLQAAQIAPKTRGKSTSNVCG